MLKLYVLIRDDIIEAQQAVQAGHAVAEFARDYPKEFKEWQDGNNTLIYLSARNIFYWKEVLEDGRFKHSVFNEPDMVERWSGEMGMDTAIAVAPNWTCQYLLFADLPLAFQPKPVVPQNTYSVSVEPEPEPPRKRWWQR